jgi:hypothetical protein
MIIKSTHMECNTCGNNDVHAALGKFCQHIVQMPTAGTNVSKQVALILHTGKSNARKSHALSPA